ncbi:MAG: FAD-binding oxidoreductase [Pseudomonadota bacterium]
MTADSELAPAYDVVIIGGAMMGSSAAWFLTDLDDFDGSVLVIERDPTYANSSTARTNSCMRQQFSNPINIRISQFAAEFVRTFRARMGGGEDVPEPVLQSYGYMYLADSERAADVLRANQTVQAELGAGTRLMTPDEVAAAYPFYRLDDIVLASHNLIDEGYFDGGTLFDWWRRRARAAGVTFAEGEVVSIGRDGDRVTHVDLGDGRRVACGTLVNASGPRAAVTAQMAGLDIPVEPRKRFTFIFDAAEPLDRDLPLTIDPSGVHVRTDGRYYLAGCPPEPGDDVAVAFDDLEMDHDIWEAKAWPAIAARIPAFERIKLINTWAGHYAYNTLDQNALVGPHPEVSNFIFMNGFSGHGFQQSPAMGRGVAELITYGAYRALDLTPLGPERIARGTPFIERAVI